MTSTSVAPTADNEKFPMSLRRFRLPGAERSLGDRGAEHPRAVRQAVGAA